MTAPRIVEALDIIGHGLVAGTPLAAEAVRRIDLIFEAERAINGLPAEQRLAVRQQDIAPLVAELETSMGEDPRQAVAAQRPRQGDELHAEMLGRVHQVNQ